MNTDNVVEFLRLLSLDVSLGTAAQHAASQADAPLALARLATAHGLPCSASDWSFFARNCLDASDVVDGDAGAASATIWQLVQDPAHGTTIPASAITRVIGIITQPEGGPPVVGHVVGELSSRAQLGMTPYPPAS
jgi:ABC-type enterobactin transport system permease subunit